MPEHPAEPANPAEPAESPSPELPRDTTPPDVDDAPATDAGPVPKARTREITVRRAPKFVPFLVGGGLLGIIVAAFLAFTAPESADYTASAVFGYFAVLLGAIGVLFGGVVVLVLDKLSVRRSQLAVVEEVIDEDRG